MTGLMKGKRGLIMGLANDKSLAWGIARKLHEQGAELAFSYQGEALEKRVRPLAASLGSDFLIECDVSSMEALDTAFETLATRWPTIDFLVHAIGFSDKTELRVMRKICAAPTSVSVMAGSVVWNTRSPKDMLFDTMASDGNQWNCTEKQMISR